MSESATGHQHGGGVAWREWNDESFRLARESDRPILLDISAVWCHWCHVMDQTSYSDPVVIDLIKNYYIPIRVDNDRRPDINERYNMGGWPTTAFLTPTGETLTGGTYIPPEQMRRLLIQVADYYQRNKQEISSKILAMRQRPATESSLAQDTSVSATSVASILKAVHEAFDPHYGGFGSEPKFPHADALELALRDYQRNDTEASLTLVSTTLTMMANGGIYDRVEGGFFRYSVTRDWRIPHFEKMLEGNAGLLANYVRAFQATGDLRYADVARDIMRYINNTLSDQAQGGFYGSQDADEEYYALSLEQRRQRPVPFVDRTLYVDWNAMMVSAYLQAAVILDDPAAKDFALRTLERLWHVCHRPNEGMYHYYDGAPHHPGFLSDQVHMAMALLDAYQVTGDVTYISKATELAAFCLEHLVAADGGFHDMVAPADAIGHLRLPLVPLPTNAVAARCLLRLYWLVDHQPYLVAAQRALAHFASIYERFGFFAAPYALAVSEMLAPPVKIVIVGQTDDPRLNALHRAALGMAEPWKLIQIIDPQRDQAAFAYSGFPLAQQPLAYPCIGTTCLLPVSDPARLATWRATEDNSS